MSVFKPLDSFAGMFCMARAWLPLYLLFFLFISTPCLDVSQIQVPTNGISGVLLVQSMTNVYSFNATTAKEVCEAIKMRIAKKAEVETANKNGLQTCRYGWVEERIAVIPRIEKNINCGKNNLGVIVWTTTISQMFDVFCFKPAGPGGSFETTSSRFQPTTRERTPSNKHYSTRTTHPSSIKSTSSPTYTSRSLHTSSPSISSAFNTSTTFTTLSNIRNNSQATTSPLSLSSTEFSTSSPISSTNSSTQFHLQHSSTPTSQPALSQTTTPNTSPIEAAPKTFVIISVVLLFLLVAAGASWYLKIKRRQRFPSWTRMRPKQIIETEMWKRISERHCMPEHTSKDNNNRIFDNLILQMEQDLDSL
ncbi:lymphatic vessel endothelial hyaluronic acid receptor 1-like isoform X1 [Carassius auratus]|uniref:Lymphatic vessel endothelial hyaluronic acid receptor 1-like isoform X1 n=1 Tax=Carassius auratus TaxID=7957 RepID=A0A6P6LPJ0_CARAU|nr:lymphatic vessel endothelial hyaluronic acid receptor 1-like isoform X1 [Carassius auratus]